MIAFSNQAPNLYADVVSGDANQMIDHAKRYLAVTLRACRTAAEWDTAYALMFPSSGVGGGDTDSIRALFCDEIAAGLPACS
jgi:hypothetical protein